MASKKVKNALKSINKSAKKGKVHKVMGEYKRGTLHSGSGAVVTSRKQAIAIALNKARKGRRK